MKNEFQKVMKINDSPLTYFFAGRLANKLLPWAVRKGFTPNQITAVSLTLGGLAAYLFSFGNVRVAVVGSLVLVAGFVLDCLDGQLARFTGAGTPFGFWLDIFGDRVREFLLWTCLCIGHIRSTHDDSVWMWGMLAVAALSLRVMEDLYREKALGKAGEKTSIMAEGCHVSIRTWIQRFFYFSIAERMFLLAIAAPLGLATIFFKIISIANFSMMIIFTTHEWYLNRDKMFERKTQNADPEV